MDDFQFNLFQEALKDRDKENEHLRAELEKKNGHIATAMRKIRRDHERIKSLEQRPMMQLEVVATDHAKLN